MVNFVANFLYFPVVFKLDSGFLEFGFGDFSADHHQIN